MGDARQNRSMSPSLKYQVIVAILVTAAALLVPTALSADGASARSSEIGLAGMTAGSVSTTTRAFDANDFPAAAFTDWER